MAVNLQPPSAAQLRPVAGVVLGVAAAGIRKANRPDVVLVSLEEGTRVAGLFTRNRFCAAPVTIAREHLDQRDETRALVINTGNANAGTGERGLEDARRTCADAARILGVSPERVLPFSTGVIMEPLPVDKLSAALPICVRNLAGDNWLTAANAIMTTDTIPKALSRTIVIGGKEVNVTGMAKGAGMIRPNMATMLAFVATDASLPRSLLLDALHYAAERSFNSITVDGDTSTNDAFILMATGRALAPEIVDATSSAYLQFQSALTEVACTLAQAIIRDAEGATKFITVIVEAGSSESECRRVAYTIAHSPLVKTAFFASDPNLGRILAAIGYAGVDDLDVGRVDVYLDDILVARGGSRYVGYTEADGARVMAQAEIAIRVVLNRGSARATVWTCDLSHEYVRINAEYRT